MRAVPWLLAFSCIGCTFRIGAVEPPARDGGVFNLDGSAQPLDLASAGAADLASSPSSAGDLATAPDLAGAYLIVSGAPAPSSVDLTKEGTIDWAHWGHSLATDFDHRASGNQIGNFTATGIVLQYGDGQVSYKWNDGASGLGQHDNSMGWSTTGVYVGGMGDGFAIAVPADHASRHVRLYVGGYKVTGQLRATLSDGSAPAFEDHSFGDTNGEFNVVYDIRYAAAGAGQKLTLQWTLYGGDALGNVTLQSATMLP